MGAREYLEGIVSHEGEVFSLLNNPDMPRIKPGCFGPLLGILCCDSLFEDQTLRADTTETLSSEKGLSYRIELLRGVGMGEQKIYQTITHLRDSFLSERKIDSKEGYFSVHLRKLEWQLYHFVLEGLDKVIGEGV
jgi:hypothetical protein